jgi:hypothetical protein
MCILLKRVLAWVFIAATCFLTSPSAFSRTPAEAKCCECEGDAVLMDSAAGASSKQLRAQYEALHQIEDLRVTYDTRGIPKHIRGRTAFDIPGDIESSSGRAALERVVARIRPMLLSEGTETLTLAEVPQFGQPLRSLRFLETIRGIAVRGGQLVLIVDDRTGSVVSISAHFLPDRGLTREPRLTADGAVSAVKEYLRREEDLRASRPVQRHSNSPYPDPLDVPGAPAFMLKSPPALGYRFGYPDTEGRAARLVWAIHFEAPKTILMGVEVDAIDGSIVGTEATPTISGTIRDRAGPAMRGSP